MFQLYLTDEIQSSQKSKNLLWDYMPTCLLHWKRDVLQKAPVLTMKIGALFLKRLIQHGFLAFAQIEKIRRLLIQGSKRVLVWFQTERCSGSEHQRLKGVSTLNIKELVSFLAFNHIWKIQVFPMEYLGFF